MSEVTLMPGRPIKLFIDDKQVGTAEVNEWGQWILRRKGRPPREFYKISALVEHVKVFHRLAQETEDSNRLFRICRSCDTSWPPNSEQAISVDLFNECVTCRFGGSAYPHGSKSGTKEEMDQITQEWKRRRNETES